MVARFRPHLFGLVIILVGAFGVRACNLAFNTAFLDEAHRLVTGHRLLAGAPISQFWWSPSYPLAYPIFAILVDRAGGLLAVRMANILFNMATIIILYAITRRLFSAPTGLLAAAVYAFSASPIIVSRLATYDAMSIFFLSLTIFLLTKGLQDERRNLLLLGALTGFCAFLAKHVGGFYLPFIALALSFHRRKAWVWRDFVTPLAFLGAGYAALYLSDLVLPFLSGIGTPLRGADEAANLQIVRDATTFLGPAMALALLAIVERPQKRRLTALLACAGVLILLYHFADQTPKALRRHAAYGLVFLAPVAGLGLHTVLTGWREGAGQGMDRGPGVAERLGGLLALALTVLLWYRSWQTVAPWERYWPNAEGSVAYLAQRLKGDEVMLVESKFVYYYYLELHGPHLEGLRMEDNFCCFTYDGLEDDQAILEAIDDRYFDFVVLDGSFTWEFDEEILARLPEGYRLTFTDPDETIPRKGIISIFERVTD